MSISATEITLQGHAHTVLALAFSSDSKFLVSGSKDNTIRLWNATTGSPLRYLQGHNAPVTTIVLSPNRKAIASASDDGAIKVWSVKTGVVHWDFMRKENAPQLAFSPDSQFVAVGYKDGFLGLYDLKTQELKELTFTPEHATSASISALTFTPEGLTLIVSSLETADTDAQLIFYDLKTHTVIATVKMEQSVNALLFPLNGTYLLVGLQDGQIQIWDREKGEVFKKLDHGNQIHSVSLNYSGHTLVSASRYGVKRWELVENTVKDLEFEYNDPITKVAISPNGRQLAVAIGTEGKIIITGLAETEGTTTAIIDPDLDVDALEVGRIEARIAFLEMHLRKIRAQIIGLTKLINTRRSDPTREVFDPSTTSLTDTVKLQQLTIQKNQMEQELLGLKHKLREIMETDSKN